MNKTSENYQVIITKDRYDELVRRADATEDVIKDLCSEYENRLNNYYQNKIKDREVPFVCRLEIVDGNVIICNKRYSDNDFWLAFSNHYERIALFEEIIENSFSHSIETVITERAFELSRQDEPKCLLLGAIGGLIVGVLSSIAFNYIF